jgi:hypothetical protein
VWYSVGCKFFSLPINVPDLTEHQIFQTLTITYASEVCPVALRGYFTTYVNFCWGLGQVIGIGVIKSMLPRQDQWSYRIPYALQWMYVFPAIYFQWVANPRAGGQFHSLSVFSSPQKVHGGLFGKVGSKTLRKHYSV